MNMYTNIIKVLLINAIILLSSNTLSSQSCKEKLPNIIVILADDMGLGDVSKYNPESKVQTRYIDQLATEGLRFSDAHTTSAVCTPSRYSILTGQYNWRSPSTSHVIGPDEDPIIPKDRMTLASMLKNKGYHSACIGKWHLGLKWNDKNDWSKGFTDGPTKLGFDYFYGIPASLDMANYAYLEYEKPIQAPTIQIDKSPMPAMWRGGLRAQDFKHVEVLSNITYKAEDYLEKRAAASQDSPFFMYFSLTSPHTPHIVPEQIEGTQIAGASQAGERGDLVYFTDWAVGKIMKKLDRLGIADNTIVIFTADNGAHSFNHKRFGHAPHLNYRGQKADIFEGGHRVPMVVRWPGVVKENSVSDETISLADFMATFAAITGYKLPDNAGEDSYSILPILQNQTMNKSLREATVHSSGNGLLSIRVNDWKLTPGNLGSGGYTNPKDVPAPNSGTLYNLKWDASETTNRYDNRPNDVRNFKALLQKYKNQKRSTVIPRNDEFWKCANTQPTSDQWYIIKNKDSGLNLRNQDCETASEINVELFRDTGGCAQWRFINNNGVWTIQNKHSGLNMRYDGEVVRNNETELELISTNNTKTYFYVIPTTNDPGYYHIQHVGSKLNIRNKDCQAVNNETTIEFFNGFNDCARWELIPVSDSLKVLEDTLGKNVLITKNPVSELVTLSSSQVMNAIEFFDLKGQLVLQQKQPAQTQNIDVSSLKSGAYLIKAVLDNTTEVLKIIKK